MGMTRDQLRAEAMALDPKDREVLAEALLLSLTEDDRKAIDAAWLAEVRSREEAFARGESSTSPVDEVITRVRSKARR